MTPDEIQKDRETPSTSWAVWAWQAYRDGALVDPATLTAENAALKERVAELEARVKALAEALVWCSGSSDFNEGGQARVGWLKLCAPLIESE